VISAVRAWGRRTSAGPSKAEAERGVGPQRRGGMAGPQTGGQRREQTLGDYLQS
jgi:hypothetical protein